VNDPKEHAYTMPVITDEFRFLNFVEAAFWIVVAVIAVAIGARRPGRVRRRCFLLAATLIPFGLSDVVETGTGAWWRPWWLFVWKAACVAVLLALLVEHYFRRFAGRSRPPPAAPEGDRPTGVTP
jgi:hypothetical protein